MAERGVSLNGCLPLKPLAVWEVEQTVSVGHDQGYFMPGWDARLIVVAVGKSVVHISTHQLFQLGETS